MQKERKNWKKQTKSHSRNKKYNNFFVFRCFFFVALVFVHVLLFAKDIFAFGVELNQSCLNRTLPSTFFLAIFIVDFRTQTSTKYFAFFLADCSAICLVSVFLCSLVSPSHSGPLCWCVASASPFIICMREKIDRIVSVKTRDGWSDITTLWWVSSYSIEFSFLILKEQIPNSAAAISDKHGEKTQTKRKNLKEKVEKKNKNRKKKRFSSILFGDEEYICIWHKKK